MTTVGATMLPLTLKVLSSEMDLAEIVRCLYSSGSTTMLRIHNTALGSHINRMCQRKMYSTVNSSMPGKHEHIE
jgi:hypothetical protein